MRQLPFVKLVMEKLRRVETCFSDGQPTDVGKTWLDLLTQLGLLARVCRSPARWIVSDQGRDAIEPSSTEPVVIIAAEMNRLGYGLHESHALSIWLTLEDHFSEQGAQLSRLLEREVELDMEILRLKERLVKP